MGQPCTCCKTSCLVMLRNQPCPRRCILHILSRWIDTNPFAQINTRNSDFLINKPWLARGTPVNSVGALSHGYSKFAPCCLPRLFSWGLLCCLLAYLPCLVAWLGWVGLWLGWLGWVGLGWLGWVRLGGWVVGWLVAWVVCCYVAMLLCCIVAMLLGCLVAWLLEGLVARLLGCLVAWLLGCSVARLLCCLMV